MPCTSHLQSGVAAEHQPIRFVPTSLRLHHLGLFPERPPVLPLEQHRPRVHLGVLQLRLQFLDPRGQRRRAKTLQRSVKRCRGRYAGLRQR